MTELVACVSTGKGTWMSVARLIKDQDWEGIFIVAPAFALESFQPAKPCEFIVIDPERPLSQLVEDIYGQLKDKVKGVEVALNMESGSGREHMALLAAVLKIGVGIRLVDGSGKGTEEI